MSHVADCKAQFKILDAMELAAKRLGGKLIRDLNQFRWFGHFVDDSRDWKTMFTAERAGEIERMTKQDRISAINEAMSKCDHVIRFPNAKYDVGVVSQKDGTYALRWDYYGAGGLIPYMGDRQGSRFKQAYAVEAAKLAAVKRGYKTRECVKSDGSIVVEMFGR